MARRPRSKAGRALKSAGDRILGWLTVAALGLLRRLDRRRMANMIGPLMRRVGPWFPEHRIGRNNLAAAFPDKSPQEIETILGGVWDNLGRYAAEFAHIDRMTIYNPSAPHQPADLDATYDETTRDRFLQLRDSGKPSLVFSAHLANWELPACAPRMLGMATSILYRRPNIGATSDAIVALRERCMGNMVAAGLDAPFRLGRALERGDHVAMLVDQHTTQGVDVVFFGRWAKANPLIAQLARLTGAPIYGIRAIRLPDGNHFRGELTDEIAPVRGADGIIDIQATTQAISNVVEGWVREYPEQWLWLHRRWR
jgi:Kdo2-lipid IVA lauroyltransferase/acyltransferase